MEFRGIFDTIPEQFDKWRPEYCKGAFDRIISITGLNENKSVLEIGPGTGQATQPILETRCNYLGIELGKNLYRFTKNKFSKYTNFNIVNGDFENYNFNDCKFDIIFSAATIQWIPESIAFSRSYELLKSGGYLVMMLMQGDYKTPDIKLYEDIQKVYTKYFYPETPYTQRCIYTHALNYGFKAFQQFYFHSKREYNASDYIEYLGTHCDHIALKEPYRSRFFWEIKNTIINHGDKIKFNDTVIVYITQKP